MSNTTKQLLPSQIGGIDREWLEEEIIDARKWHGDYSDGYLDALKSIKSQLFPIEPIMEDAIEYGNVQDICREDFIKHKQSHLTQPITIKL